MDTEGCCCILWMGIIVLVSFFWLREQGHEKLEEWNLSSHDQRDFFIGFFGIIILNALLYLLSLVLRGASAPPEMKRITMSLPMVLPWVVNLTLLIFFAFYRPRIAEGALALVGFLIVWGMLAGVLFFVSCFVVLPIGCILESCLGGY